MRDRYIVFNRLTAIETVQILMAVVVAFVVIGGATLYATQDTEAAELSVEVSDLTIEDEEVVVDGNVTAIDVRVTADIEWEAPWLDEDDVIEGEVTLHHGLAGAFHDEFATHKVELEGPAGEQTVEISGNLLNTPNTPDIIELEPGEQFDRWADEPYNEEYIQMGVSLKTEGPDGDTVSAYEFATEQIILVIEREGGMDIDPDEAFKVRFEAVGEYEVREEDDE